MAQKKQFNNLCPGLTTKNMVLFTFITFLITDFMFSCYGRLRWGGGLFTLSY
jgi:hypothetical protein